MQTITKYEGLKKVKSGITKLGQKKAGLYRPKTRRLGKTKEQKIKDLLGKTSRDGLKPEEIAK